VVVAEGTASAAFRAGGMLNAVFCGVFEMRGAKIRKLVSYVVPLAGPFP
jgi:ketosteroid isomerase-like protein